MSYEALARLRTFFPGVLIALLWLPLLGPVFAFLGVAPATVNTLVSMAMVGAVLGAIYEALGVRRLLSERSFNQINSHVSEQLLRFCGVENVAGSPEMFKALRPRFYQLIDNDKSLTLLADRIRKNGAVWTSSIDAAIICGVFGMVYLALGLSEGGGFLLGWGIALLIVAGASYFVLLRLIVGRHLELCDEQLGQMTAIYSAEVQAMVVDAVSGQEER